VNQEEIKFVLKRIEEIIGEEDTDYQLFLLIKLKALIGLYLDSD
jgi:hypothetical protein